MARLGLWDGIRFDPSRAYIARRMIRLDGKDYERGDAIPDGFPAHVLRRLWHSRLIGYDPNPDAPKLAKLNPIDKPFIPEDWASMPFLALRALARRLAGTGVSKKPEVIGVIEAELARRGA